MKKYHAKKSGQNLGLFIVAAAVVILLVGVKFIFAGSGSNGFDQYGYNYQARIFQGKADGVDRLLDGKLWGDPTYANDNIVMKWSKAWDEARFGTVPWTCDAWTDNEWNGKMPGGSGEIWHYKMVWVGPQLAQSSCWRAGGYPIWGEFEVIFSQGSFANQHFWDAHARPAGLGGF